MWWFLTREVLRLRGQINRQAPWDVMVDLFFYRDPEEVIERDKKKNKKRFDLFCLFAMELLD
mgnify:CR=1 FL=1